MNHTKEPWEVRAWTLIYDCDDGKNLLASTWGHKIAGGEKQALANAERIVACVNACAGIADPSAIPEAIRDLQKLVELGWENVRKGDDGKTLERIEKTLAKLKGGS